MIGPMDRCLIVEKNFLIRLDLADMLQSLGIRNVDEAESISQAMELIAATKYSVVFINIIHADKSSQAVAEELKRQKVPLVVTTAYLATTDLPPAMMDAPIISKPYSLEVIRTLLPGLLEPTPDHSSSRSSTASARLNCRPSTHSLVFRVESPSER